MVTGTDLNEVARDLEMKIEMMTKWLRDSGMTVNEGKTEFCLFHKNNDVSKSKIGRNLLSNKIAVINNKTDCEWLNMSWNTNKVKCKLLLSK